MAKGYLPVDRDQLFLIPPDIREWLPKDHFVWWLLDVLGRLDTKAVHRLRRRGAQGRAGYDPEMLLALLLYAYTNKVRSSREIERLCMTDVAFRVICAGARPDHTTIARFRADHAPLCEQLFAQVLLTCARAGLAQVGVVALDGTKVAANASRSANRTRAQLLKERARLEAKAKEMFAEAAATDAEEDERYGPRRGDELPEELLSTEGRKAALDAAMAKLAERQGQHRSDRKPERWRARLELYEAKLAEAKRRWAGHLETRAPQGMKARFPQGRDVARAEKVVAYNREKLKAAESADNKAQVNLTDLDSRLMNTQHGYLQAYNAQAVVNHIGVILAAEVFCSPNDMELFRPMLGLLAAGEPALGPVGVVLADAGYCSDANLSAPGPVRLIATRNSRQLRADKGTAFGPAPSGLSPRQAMEHALRTREGKSLYAQRSWTIEPAFGNLKHNLGFSRFSRRGHPAARAEWHLVTASANLLKLFRYFPAAARFA